MPSPAAALRGGVRQAEESSELQDAGICVSRSASALVGRARRLSAVGGGRPATEELQRLLRARTGLGGVREHRQPVVCGEVEPVVAQAELADHGMVELLDAGVVKEAG